MHDSFIRSILSDRSLATDYFRSYLPVQISQALDFSTLLQVPDTYLSDELQKSMSDIVYDCKTKNSNKGVKISLLVEHKSQPDKHTPIQIGSYIFSALQKQAVNKESLTLVVPVLLYHGKGKWRYQTLSGLFENIDPEWLQFVPDFSYIYNNLGEIPDEQVEALNNKFLAASILTLKHAFEKDWLKQHALQMLILAEEAPDHLQKAFVIYLFGRSNLKTASITKLFESLPSSYKNKVMSTLEYFKEEGLKEGRIETEEKKNREFVKNLLLANKFSVAEISNYANVSEAFVQQEKKCWV